jgi:hypothetical protein
LAGVRLSFALSWWLELGQSYPQAMQALITVRDKKALAIAQGQGSFALFHDVAAINRTLGEELKTVALFKWLHQTCPALAQPCYPVAQGDLVGQREYEICSCYIPDPRARLEEARQMRQIHLEIADENQALDSPQFREYADQRFAGEVGCILEILLGAGRKQEAEQVRESALAISACPAVEAALDRAFGPEGPTR